MARNAAPQRLKPRLKSRRRLRALQSLFELLRSGQLRLVAVKVGKRLHSDGVGVGLSRDLDVPFRDLGSRRSSTIRPMKPSEMHLFLRDDAASENVNVADPLEAELETSYVLQTTDGTPTCMAFLVDHTQNELLRRIFHETVPPLARGEMLMESLLCLPRVRGRGLVIHLIPQLGTKAKELGARRLIAYVGVENTSMLRACQFHGFVPFTTRRESFRLMRRRVTFTPIAPGARLDAQQ